MRPFTRELSEPGRRDIDHRIDGRVREREANESKLSTLPMWEDDTLGLLLAECLGMTKEWSP